MKLWTIQPFNVYELIMKQGYYACDENILKQNDDYFCGNFKAAYDWLIERMKEKIGEPPSGIKYPVWAWHTYNWKRKGGDLRSSQGKKGERMVRLEIEIPDNEVVLTDFNAWHFVLNGCYMPNCDNEADYERLEEEYDNLSLDEQIAKKLESWEEVFNLTPVDSDWMKNGAYIQATFWRLDRSQIRKIEIFKSR